MHKRSLLLLLAGCLMLAQPLAAGTVTDSFSFLNDIPLYSALLEATKGSGEFDTAVSIRNEIQATTYPSLDSAEATVLSIKADTAFARLCTELVPRRDELARSVLEEAERKAATLEEGSLFSYCCLADIYGIWFLASSRNLSKGIASSRNVNRAVSAYPEEVSAILLKASSLTFAPSLTKRQVREALDMYLELLRQEDVTLSRWDLASLYSGIGIACYKTGDYANAVGYLTAAKSLYRFDPTVDDYLAKSREAD